MIEWVYCTVALLITGKQIPHVQTRSGIFFIMRLLRHSLQDKILVCIILEHNSYKKIYKSITF